ncbi:MAG: hypothetical protein AABZ22_09660 [Nitrospirota bacterium]
MATVLPVQSPHPAISDQIKAQFGARLPRRRQNFLGQRLDRRPEEGRATESASNQHLH